jgi:DNA-binding CsgD family transcriptional regulator/tetratricopeptide (TPR) repeat protein
MGRRWPSPVLVSREAEIARLRAAFDRASSGEPAMALVAGEAGIGKSRLCSDFVDWAIAAGALALVGGCLDVGEGVLPYAPVTEALRQLGAMLEPAALDTVLGSARADLACLLPELADQHSPAEPEEQAWPARLFEHILVLLGRLAATRPVVFVVEDVHWADRSTRDLLVFLRRNLRSGVALVMTCRTDELHTGHPVRPFLAELERSGIVDRIDLGRLDRRGAAELIAGVLGRRPSSRIVSDLFERSDGNPFYIEELIATDASGGGIPQRLRDLLLARVEALAESAQRVLRIASVASGPVDADLLAAVAAHAGVDPDTLFDGLREAVSRHLLVTDAAGERHAFRHALGREATYHDLLPGERRRLHAAVATALEERHGDGGTEARALGELAYHWYAAHDEARAFTAAVKAGQAAARSFAPAEAARQFERALELWDRVARTAASSTWSRADLLIAAADSAYLVSDWARAAAHLRGALECVDRDVEPLRAARVMLQRARCLWGRDEARAILAAAEALVPGDPPSPDLAFLLSVQIRLALFDGRDQDALSLAERMLAVARAISDPKMADIATMCIGRGLFFTGRVEEGLALCERSLRGAVADDPDHIGPMWVNYIASLHSAGRADETIRAAREGEMVTRRLGLSAGFAAMIVANAATALVAAGRWEEAEEFIERGFDLQPGAIAEAWLRGQRGRMLVLRGDVDDGRAELLAALDIGLSEQSDISFVYRDLASSYAAEGAFDEARRQVDAALATARGMPSELLAVCQVGLAVEAHARGAGVEGFDERGRQILARARSAVTGRSGMCPDATATMLAIEAEWSRLSGFPDVEAWSRAVAAWDGLGFAVQATEARLRRAEARLATGDRRGTAEDLREAWHKASSLRARLLADEAAALASRAGVDVGTAPKRRQENVLTPREREVVGLLATGASNRDIARELYISEKTVSVHVSNIMAKLGVANRGKAAAEATRRNLLPPMKRERRSGLPVIPTA